MKNKIDFNIIHDAMLKNTNVWEIRYEEDDQRPNRPADIIVDDIILDDSFVDFLVKLFCGKKFSKKHYAYFTKLAYSPDFKDRLWNTFSDKDFDAVAELVRKNDSTRVF